MVELMVVVVIIAVLVSLVASAVMKVVGTVPQVETSTDIAQLATALEAFKSDFELTDPPPSVLILNESAPLSTASGPFLQKMFGKNLGATDWNGDGTIGGTWTLEGEQCLVFYLGGIGNRGFSFSKISPTPVTGQKTRGPYFTFKTSRLVPLTAINPSAPSAFLVYIDAWQTKNNSKPYAYFSSSGINNAYGAHCPSITASPYNDGAGHFANSNTYQIVSAGKDGNFATNGVWAPSGGTAKTNPGYDDQANFSSTVLGVGQN